MIKILKRGSRYCRHLSLTLIFAAALASFLCWFFCPSCINGEWIKIDPNGIKIVNTAVGAVSFALGYINTAKEKRVRGVLLEQVIHEKYPYYGYIFVLNGAFVILGQYVCTVDARVSVLFCLIGLIASLCYILEMSFSIVFLKKRREKLVSEYIEYVKQGRLENQDSENLILHVAHYVAERFLERDLPVNLLREKQGSRRRNSEIDPDSKMIQNLLDLCKANDTSRTSTNGDFLEQFGRLFFEKGSSDEEKGNPMGILYSLPVYQERLKTLCDEIRRFGHMWQNLFSNIQDTYLQTELAYLILDQADGQVTVPLCCGLVYCLHMMRIPSIDVSPDQIDWIKVVRFLAHIDRIAEKEGNMVSDDRTGIQIQCRDMISAFFCLSLFEQAVSKEELFSLDFIDSVRDEMARYFETGLRSFWSNEIILKYLCYAQLLFDLLVMPTLYKPSRRELSRIIPEIISTAQDCLDE